MHRSYRPAISASKAFTQDCITDTMTILAKDCSSVEAQAKFIELSYKYFELGPLLFMV